MNWNVYGTGLRIDLLHVPDCPNHAVARTRIQAALRRAGILGVIREREVDSLDEAARVGMRGSPTILIDGRDLFAEVDQPIALACRLYHDGRGLVGAPTVDQLVAVFCLATRGPAPDTTRTETNRRVDLFGESELDGPVADAVRRVARRGFLALWAGQPLDLDSLAADRPAVDEAVEHLRRRGRIELSGDRRVLGIHGVTIRSTPHRIDHAGGTVHTWCALDAVGISAALRLDARVHTSCGSCDGPLSVPIHNGRPSPPPEAVLWHPDSDAGHLLDDFCAAANLFCSPEHARQSQSAGSVAAGRMLTLEEVADIGWESWSDVATDRF